MHTPRKALMLVVVLVISLFSVSLKEAEAKTFTDLGSGVETIDYLIAREIISGYPDGTFRPNNPVTRAEAATMLGIALGLDGAKRATKFPDVAATHFASGFVTSSVNENIIGGYPDGTFKPNRNITRGETALIIARAFSFTENYKMSYTDVSRTDPLYGSISLVASAGITGGYPDGSFKPNHHITREHFAFILARALNPDFRSKVVPPKPEGPVESEDVVSPEDVVTPDGDVGDNVEEIKYVTVNGLNVRSGPSVNDGVISQFNKNDQVTTHGKSGLWYHVSSGDVTGYVHGQYLANEKLATRIIAIDPGHGGSDPGARGNGLIEKELNLDVSLRVQKKLEQAGIKVVMTRTTDQTLALNDRVPIAIKGKADTFVSIHSNAHSNTAANGTESFYYRSVQGERSNQSQQLASFIQKRILDEVKTANRGVKTMGFRVLKANPLPSALIELGFITNTADAAKFKQEVYKEKAAVAIYQGILDYYNWKER